MYIHITKIHVCLSQCFVMICVWLYCNSTYTCRCFLCILWYKMIITVLEMKIWIYWSKLSSSIKKRTEKFTGPNKILLVLGRRIGAHHEDCHWSTNNFIHVNPAVNIHPLYRFAIIMLALFNSLKKGYWYFFCFLFSVKRKNSVTGKDIKIVTENDVSSKSLLCTPHTTYIM